MIVQVEESIGRVEDIEIILTDALAPLVSIINRFDLSPEEVHATLAADLARSAQPDVWPDTYTKRWSELKDAVVSLLSLDVLDIESKAGHLIGERANWVTSLRILSDVRPVFDDTANEMKASLLVNTLVVRFTDASGVRAAYFAIDPTDLDQLEDQIKRARRKNALIAQKYEKDKTTLLMWASENDDSETGEDK